MKGVDAVIQRGGGAHAAADVLHKTSAARRFSIYGRLIACVLLAATLALGLIPSPAIEQAVAAAAAANGTLSITHSPVGGTFAKGNPVYLYSQAFSSAKNLITYQWYRNTTNANTGGVPIDGATAANLADESVSTLDAGTYYYYVVATDSRTGETATSSVAEIVVVDKGAINGALQNGDFSDVSTFNGINQGPTKEQTTTYVCGFNLPGWNTTQGRGSGKLNSKKRYQVFGRVVTSNANAVLADGVDRFIELSDSYASSVYQEVATVPGSVYSWNVQHAARNANNTEALAIVIGPALDGVWSNGSSEFPYGETTGDTINTSFFGKIADKLVQEITNGAVSSVNSLSEDQLNTMAGNEYYVSYEGNEYYVYIASGHNSDEKYANYVFNDHAGTYTVPEGQGTTVFGFAGVYCPAPSSGNLLDNISFQQGSPIDASSDVDSQGNGILSAVAKDGYAYGLLEVRGSTVTSVSNFTTKAGDAVLSEDPGIAAVGGQGWYVPGSGTISFSGLTPGKTYRVVEVPVSAIAGVQNSNLTPSVVLDENCYDDFAVKPVSGGDGSSIGNIQVTARSEDDGTCTLIVDPARDDVEYAIVAANAAGDGPAEPVVEVQGWASSASGRLDFTGLSPNTSYVVVGRPMGYEEITLGTAAGSGSLIKTPPASFKDLTTSDVERSDDGESVTVKNATSASQEYMVYDVETKLAVGDGWYTISAGGSQLLPLDPNRTYQVVTRASGAIPAPGVRSYPAPTEQLTVDYVNEVVPKGASMPKTLQYRAQDGNNGETWRFGTADTWMDGTGGANVNLTAMLDGMSTLEDETGAESTGGTFWYRTKPSFDPAVALEKTLVISARPEAPSQGTRSASSGAGFWIDYATDELVVGPQDIQFRRVGSSSWTRYAAGTRMGLPLLGWSEKDPFGFEIRTAAVDTGDAATSAFASEKTTVSIPARADGPTAEGDSDVKGSKDGSNLRLENVTSGMEYRVWGNGGTWTRITDGDIKTAPDGTRYIDVAVDGTYEVRAAATDDAPASFGVTASTTDSALSIKTLVHSFDQLGWGYSPAPSRTVTIKNTGTAQAVVLDASLGGGSSSNFSLTGDASGTVEPGVSDESRSVSPVLGLAPGVYGDTLTVRYKSSTGTTEYTAAVPVYVQVRQATQEPPRDITATVTDTQMIINAKVPTGYALADPRMQFSIDGGITWSDSVATTGDGDERNASFLFPDLNAATSYTVLVRMAADDLGYKIESDEASAQFYTAYEAPASVRMTIDYVHETVSYPSGQEATSATDGGGDAIGRGGSITDYLSGEATTFSLRVKASLDLAKVEIPASSWTDVTIPARPAAPTNATTTDADSSKATNGSITLPGSASVEYRKAGDTSWIPVSGATVTGLAAGSYEVRLPATGSSFASMVATVEVGASKEVYVTYFKNDGSEGDGVHETQTVVPGSATTAPATPPTRDHYTFAGWHESDDGGATLSGSAFEFATLISADLSLYANWTADSYQLTYDTAGGSTAPAGATVSYDGSVTAPDDPTRVGYQFSGWALSGRAADNTAVFDFESTLAENFAAAGATPPQDGQTVTLTAQWSALAYGVTFDAATGDAADDPTAPGDVDFDAYATSSKAAPSPEPTRVGYAFDSWHLVGADGELVAMNYQFSKTLGENLEAASLASSDPAAGVVIKAKWNELTYTLSFDPAGGTPGSIAQADVKFTAKTTEPATVKRAGFAFGGWRLVTGGTDDAPVLADVSFDFAKSLEDNLAAASVTAPGGTQPLKLNLRAAWTANDYAVLFDADADGVADAGETKVDAVAFDAIVPGADAVPAAERAGWTFSHWKLAGAEDAVAYDPAATLEASFAAASLAPAENATQVVLVPVFAENSYTLFFDADDDGIYDADAGDTKVENHAYTSALDNAAGIAVPYHPGYTFAAWHLIGAEGTAFESAFALDATLQANFEAASTVPPKTTGAEIRLTPAFTPNAYTVVLDVNANGAVDADEAQTAGVVYDAAVADSPLAQPDDPERPGYLFQGWTIAGATGNAYYDFALSLEDNCVAASFEPSKNAVKVLLQPAWAPCRYPVTFDAQGGNTAPSGPEAAVAINGTVSAPSDGDLKRAGYLLGDWRLRTGGTDDAPELAAVAYDFSVTMEANFKAAGFDLDGSDDSAPDVPVDGAGVVLYAKWNPNSYTLVYDSNGNGTADADERTVTGSVEERLNNTPTDPMRPGYTFAGRWHLAARAEGSTAEYNSMRTLFENLEDAGFDTTLSGTEPAVPANNGTLMVVPEWNENTYTLAFTANPVDDPDDVAGTYPPDSVVVDNPTSLSKVAFESAASTLVMPQVSCTGYKFVGWRFAGADLNKSFRYDVSKTFKENLAAAGYDVGEGTGATLPGNNAVLQLEGVWTQIPLSVKVPTTLMAQIGFDAANPDVRTITVNPDLDPNDGQPAPELKISSTTEAPVQVTGIEVNPGPDLDAVFPEGLHKGADAVSLSLNGTSLFNGATLADGTTSTLFPQRTGLSDNAGFLLPAYLSGSASEIVCDFGIAAPMAIPMKQITDPSAAATFLSLSYTFAIVPGTAAVGGE